MRWHWLWFLPLSLVVSLITECHTVPYALRLAALAHGRWSWFVFVSPSAYFCLTTIVESIIWPVQWLMAIPALVSAKDDLQLRRRWLYCSLIVVGVILLPLLTDTLIWGSFPFALDNQNIQHLRMIPFIPWPSGGYNTF